MKMITSLLIANRGEIAVRIIKTARSMGITTIAIASPQDRNALHVETADHAVILKDGPARKNYLNQQAIIDAALQTGATAIHPGYGFLSENPEFAQAVLDAGLIFVGPPASVIAQMGLKDKAKQLMAASNVPIVPGYLGEDQTEKKLADEAAKIGFPVLIKAVAGGGGKGMRRVENADGFLQALRSAKREAQASFGDDKVLIEKYIQTPRHIEVQILSDNFGSHIHLFERDCSLQRRHQKVIEEAPAPNMPDDVREAMTQAAISAAKAIGYRNAGTVEFIADASDGLKPDGFWFMEMNTRLQVEHPVTEAVTAVDLVKAQLEIAAGLPLAYHQDDICLHGHAVEARLYAEDPVNDFRPTPGTMHHIHFPQADGVRVDSGIRSGDEISSSYDPMVAKIITHHHTRDLAFHKLAQHLQQTICIGTTTNRDFLGRLCRAQLDGNNQLHTGFIEEMLAQLTEAEPLNVKALASAALCYVTHAPSAFTGFRQWGAGQTPLTFSVEHNPEPLDCSVHFNSDSDAEFCLGETVITCTDIAIHTAPTGITQLKASMDGELVSARYLHHQAHICILTRDAHLSLSLIQDRQKASKDRLSNEISAPMTSVVREVHVQLGQQVEAEDLLVSVEAMKMEYPLYAPYSAIIEEINCKTGDNVSESHTLIRLSHPKNDEAEHG